MICLWLQERQLRLADVPVPEPAAGEALIRVLKAGICNTDLELIDGYYPFAGIPGHEFVGIVESPSGELNGRRVVGEINCVCGSCGACRAGRRNHCERRSVLGIAGRDGAFAEYVTLPIENLHVLPDGVATEEAVFVEPLAAALQIQEQVPIGRGQRVVVIGDGKLGQLAARTLALTGCELMVVGHHDSKLGLLDAVGAATRRADEVRAGERFDVAVECTGNPAGFDLARQSLRPGGTLVMKSTYAGELTIDAAAVVVDEITLVGSRCGPFGPAVGLLADRRVNVAPLVHAEFALRDGLGAFEKAAAPGVLKVLLEVS